MAGNQGEVTLHRLHSHCVSIVKTMTTLTALGTSHLRYEQWTSQEVYRWWQSLKYDSYKSLLSCSSFIEGIPCKLMSPPHVMINHVITHIRHSRCFLTILLLFINTANGRRSIWDSANKTTGEPLLKDTSITRTLDQVLTSYKYVLFAPWNEDTSPNQDTY